MASKRSRGGKKQGPASTKKTTTKPASTETITTGKYRIVVGRDWEIRVDIEGDGGQPEKILQEVRKHEQLKDERKERAGRLSLSATIVAASLISLGVATAWGWTHADFSGVSSVWQVTSVPIGWVAGHFFKSDGRKDKNS